MPSTSSYGSGTQSQHVFALVPSVNLQRSVFDRSHGLKTAFDFGMLIPIFVDEALPGDTLSLRMNTFGRMAPFMHPIMENLYMDFFFFSVPNRLLWSNWQKFMGEKEPNEIDPPGPTFLVPHVTPPGGGFAVGSLADYFGIPCMVAGTVETRPSALPFRAYNRIYQEWFRDENLIGSVVLNTGDGPDATGDSPLRKRGKRHDYFTSALPWPQKGPTVAISLGQTAPVIPTSPAVAPIFTSTGTTPQTGPLTHAAITGGAATGVLYDVTGAGNTGAGNLVWTATTGLQVNMAAVTSVSINLLREAVATQRLLERDARGGTRYTEIIRSHFGVISPDARMQRPEYLGGGTVRINVNPVASTFAGTIPTPPPGAPPTMYPGTLGAYATTSAGGVGFTKSFTEHCTLIGLVSCRADNTYQQGMEKMWLRRSRYDFYWPEFAHLGEQAVRNGEIFYRGVNGTAPTFADGDLGTFGYQERYAEYRYKPSRVTNIMRSSVGNPPTAVSGTLQSWHLAQDFATQPLLNQSFIEEAVPIDRVLVSSTEPEVLLDCFFSYRCVRPMPVYAVPGLSRL